MQISFDRLFAKNLQFFFAKLVQSVSLCHRLSKKLNFNKIWQVKVGQNKDLVCYTQKQSFRQCAWGLRQLGLKPSFLGLKGGLWVCKKSQKISTAWDQYFLSYVKKLQGGGQFDPPPSRNRVNHIKKAPFLIQRLNKLALGEFLLINQWELWNENCQLTYSHRDWSDFSDFSLVVTIHQIYHFSHYCSFSKSKYFHLLFSTDLRIYL